MYIICIDCTTLYNEDIPDFTFCKSDFSFNRTGSRKWKKEQSLLASAMERPTV